MAYRNAMDCDWCGAKDIEKGGTARIGIKLVGGRLETPTGAELKIGGELHPFTWIDVCEACEEKAEAAARVWTREEPIFQVEVRVRQDS